MALCTTTCDGKSMVAHDEPDCLDPKLGNSTSIAYILCEEANNDLKVDYTASGTWNTILTSPNVLSNLIVANKVTIGRTSENQTADNPQKDGIPTLKTGESQTVTVTDSIITTDNHEFYNSIDGKRAWVVIAYKDGRMEVSPRQMMLMSKTPAIEYGQFQSFTLEATATFDKNEYWLPFDTQPAGVFTFQ